ncbi:MAG: hypothetical protein JXP73_12615 [Deltaproteobacteria bacterium]|nr:hypothetical protein [Deltaproteobacteria bacterium]
MRSFPLRLVVVSLLAVGCAGQISEMPTWVGFEEDNVEGGDDVAVIVLKITPPAEILLAAGRIGPDGWRGKGPASGVWLSARDGFVVARVSPSQDEMAYAVVQVRPRHLAGGKERGEPTYETGFWSAVPADAGAGGATQAPAKAGNRPAYGPTGEARIPLFKAIAGRVAFVGTIRIDALREFDAGETPQKVGITPVVSPDDIEAVRRLLASHYPKIRARVVPSPLQMMRWNRAAE